MGCEHRFVETNVEGFFICQDCGGLRILVRYYKNGEKNYPDKRRIIEVK